jgi:uncharacterized membrane protein (DUF2068 family)
MTTRSAAGSSSAPNDLERTAGLRLIVGYKLVKAAAGLAIGVLILTLMSFGLAEHLQAFALTVRNHAAEAWSIALAKWLTNAATSRRLLVIALACLLDAVFSAFEAWALRRRYRWSGWLIVAATSALLPFEAVALAKHFTAGRAVLAAANVLIVLYLVRLELSDRRGVTAESRVPPAGP